MATGKVKSSSTGGGKWGVHGGKGHMYGQQGADPMVPGQTAATAGRDGSKFAKGGKGRMFGYTGSRPARPGVTK